MNLVCVAKSDVGKKRSHNEDAYHVDVELGLFAVADGMGGHAAGEVASQEALAALVDMLLDNKQVLDDFRAAPGKDNARDVSRLLDRAVRAAAYQVFAMSQVEPERKGMGTTLSALLVQPTAGFIAHVGDSRIYMLRDGQIRQITHDHPYVAEMIKKGKMTPEEAQRSRFANLLVRAVGSNDFVLVDIRIVRCQPGDMFLLCSDGLSGYLESPREIVEHVAATDMAGSVQKLIDLALERGGRDNITVVLVRLDP